MFLFLVSGCFSALFAVVAELAVFSFLVPSGAGMDPWHLGLVSGLSIVGFVTFLFVAVIEESLKLLVLSRQIAEHPTEYPLASYVLFGFGFATTEIVLASMASGRGFIPFLSIIGMLAVHILTSFLYGWALSKGKLTTKTALVAGTAVHLLYDVLLALA